MKLGLLQVNNLLFIIYSSDYHIFGNYIKVNTGMNWNRNPIVVASGEVVLAVGGHYGTLSEIAYALVLGKPVIGYKTHKGEGVLQVHSLEEMLKLLDQFL